MTGMRLDPVLRRQSRRVGQALQLDLRLGPCQVAKAPGVQLDDRCAEADRRLDLARIGLDEQAHADIGGAQFAHHRRESVVHAGRIEPAFGGQLLAPFGHDAGGVRPVAERDGEHLVGRGHFQVERDGEAVREAGDIVVADMAPVLAQVRGNAVGARLGRDQCRADRIGIADAARVPHGRDMVDIDAEAEMVGHAAALLPGLIAGIAANSAGSASAS